MARTVCSKGDAEEVTKEIRVMQLKHRQESGYDRFSIYDPDGHFVGSAEARIKGDALESAVGALWAGLERACRIGAEEYDAELVSIYSTVIGAEDQFEKEYDEIEKDAA